MTLLPLDCRVEYHSGFLAPAECDEIYASLDGISQLKACKIEMYDGSWRPLDVGTYFLGDPEILGYDSFPKLWGGRQAWPACIHAILPRLESVAGRRFRICLCSYYPNGERAGYFHTDPPMYGDTSVIPSVSIGAERTFAFRSLKSPTDEHRLDLANGSLLIMRENCQQLYEHTLLPGPPQCKPRFNLSFRMFGFTD